MYAPLTPRSFQSFLPLLTDHSLEQIETLLAVASEDSKPGASMELTMRMAWYKAAKRAGMTPRQPGV